jgi:putative transposase
MNMMDLIDRIYTEHPYYGSRRIVAELARRDIRVNRKRVQRLMRRMGIYSVLPGPMTSTPRKESRKYPYLLRGLSIHAPNQVWCTDITYIPMQKGSMYLVAVMDWYSRYVLSWELSNTMDSDFCVRALRKALNWYGRPEIFNTDQGSQFTSEAFTGVLLENGIKISMDGKGRVTDNIFIERLWRSLKYERIYIKGYATPADLRAEIDGYFLFYNHNRLHQSHGYRTPEDLYDGKDQPLAASPDGDSSREVALVSSGDLAFARLPGSALSRGGKYEYEEELCTIKKCEGCP